MTSTYCDKTGDRTYALHMNEEQLGLIADLLNSVNDPRAVPLRQAVKSMIRENNVFDILSEKKIIQCNYCKGTGHVRYYDSFNQRYKKELCPQCKGKCQKVAIITTRYELFSPYWADKLTKEF
jgi:RecJ-like exonuclease